MSTPEEWASIYTYATTLKASTPDRPPGNEIIGRSITYIVNKLTDFWGRHKATLIPYMTNIAIAALEALVAARADINLVNPPGPP